ncbi:MAG: UbiA family prenyltransferase [Anaerolineales bacterium]|nr:UbiA family prenyltransferase [Anaerolineales bacterium]MCX7755841.1 UbiA family prenyltransferase [Anaerolineales bacterium]MDW8277464.1 UbiA family prenyltransferase [Anaerolineales bacterium]
MLSRFFALSRTTHGVLDIAMPGFAALLWLGKFPDWPVLLLSLLTAFAGYTAIYALNDLVAIKTDREKFAGGTINEGYSVEASAMRYPLAQNILSARQGWLWFGVWYAIALVGAWLLNPVIVWIVLAAAVLEVIYCRLLKVTYWRTLVSGLVKSAGPVAAVFVVEPRPALPLLLLMLVWLILWEIGGQNIPADWNDVEEDRRVGAKTIPLTFGPERAGLIVVITLVLTTLVSLFLPLIAPIPLGLPYLLGTACIGLFLLVLPGIQLYQKRESRQAARLFDRASYYPLAQLTLITIFVLLHAWKVG